MKMLNKAARRELMAMCEITQIVYGDKILSGYIGNHSKHHRQTPQPQHNKGKYLTARERNRY